MSSAVFGVSVACEYKRGEKVRSVEWNCDYVVKAFLLVAFF